jgi:hypothetical protein
MKKVLAETAEVVSIDQVVAATDAQLIVDPAPRRA